MNEGITDDVRKREEEYFRRKDRELLERMRQASDADQSRKDLESATGIHDASLISDLEALGFTPDTIKLLPLVPVLQVAWAEGGVSTSERTMLTELARSRGITAGSASDARLIEWMDQRPSDETFSKANRLISAMLDSPASTGQMSADELIKYCEQIAAASGGFFGIGKVSSEERGALQQIASQLKKR